MDIGTGIAIASIWVFVASAWIIKNVSNVGAWIALIIGIILTVYLNE